MIHIPDSIFPKDSQGNLLCPKCMKQLKQCTCPSLEPKKAKLIQVNPVIRLDKSGRKGKVVTLITRLPANEAYLKEMSKKLKTKTGSGGTFYIEEGVGIIELQGDHKKALEDFKNCNPFSF